MTKRREVESIRAKLMRAAVACVAHIQQVGTEINGQLDALNMDLKVVEEVDRRRSGRRYHDRRLFLSSQGVSGEFSL
jgi:hypothetical protein